MLGTRLKLLRMRLLLLRVIVLLLVVVLLLARIIRLRLARGERLAADLRLLVVSLVVTLIGSAELAGLLLLVVRLILPKLLLGRGDQPKIMLSVLVIVFRCNWISRALRVAGQLEIFFRNVGRRSANFYIRSIGLVHS